jgi:hypothetical protein
MIRVTCYVILPLIALVVAASMVGSLHAELFINEIHFDPGSQGQPLFDNRDEYIELRGTPGMSLANHYLIFVENEDDEFHVDPTGNIENIFNLGSLSMGSNGFLLLRQDDNLYNDATVAAGTTSLEHSNAASMNGWGNGASSLVFHQGVNNLGFPKIEIENGGATAMLIRNRVEVGGGLNPTLNMDMDQGNDGLDSRPGSLQTPINDWASKWEIIDSIGWLEGSEVEYGRSYGRVTYSANKIGEPLYEDGPIFTQAMADAAHEPGTSFADVGFEIELVARWGNSTGYTHEDWHVSNLTSNPTSGSAGPTNEIPNVFDLRQSGDPHPSVPPNPQTPPDQPPTIESNKGVPYGTKLTNTLGAPNFIIGDFNKDGYVNTADYVVWRKTYNSAGSESNHPLADPNHDFVVDGDDYEMWAANLGSPDTGPVFGGAPASTSSVPEPSTILLLSLFAAVLLCSHRSGRAQR